MQALHCAVAKRAQKLLIVKAAKRKPNATGVTVPYGILLEATLGSEITLTAVPAIPIPPASVMSLDWSSDQKYIAIGMFSVTNPLRIYSFNNVNRVVEQVVSKITLVPQV